MADKIDVVEKNEEKEPTEEEIREMINEDIDDQGTLLGDIAMRMSRYDADLASMSLASALLDVALNCDLDIHELLDFIDSSFHENIERLDKEAQEALKKEKETTGN